MEAAFIIISAWIIILIGVAMFGAVLYVASRLLWGACIDAYRWIMEQ
jgi:uncharacterized membrane protein YdcZ (DUF606 family)